MNEAMSRASTCCTAHSIVDRLDFAMCDVCSWLLMLTMDAYKLGSGLIVGQGIANVEIFWRLHQGIRLLNFQAVQITVESRLKGGSFGY